GKWLFPRAMIDLWVLRNTESGEQTIRPDIPPVIGGSHDPLLEWAIRESGSELAVLFDGSLDGVRRVIDHQVRASGMHVIDNDSGTYNRHLIDHNLADGEAVLLQWAWREQGLITAPGNPLQLHCVADLARPGVRVIDRQQSAGSHLLLRYLLQQADIRPDTLDRVTQPARNERDAALAVADGVADAALGIAAVAHQYRLDFVALHAERYDLLLHRRDFFEPPLQALFEFARTPAFADKAHALGGYDITDLGRVVDNAP